MKASSSSSLAYVWLCLGALALAVGPALRGSTTLAASDAQTVAAQTTNHLPAAWSHWQYFRTIGLSETSVQQLVSVSVPQDVYARSTNHLADLRVIDDAGIEVPFILEAPRGSENMAQRGCPILESSFVPGKYTQIVCDAGENSPFHNAITLQTPDRNFMAWADVSVSDDAREWRIVNDRSPIYDFAGRGLNGLATLHYGDTNARYIRVRISLGDNKFPVSSVAVLYQAEQRQKSVPVNVPATPESLHVSGESIWRADFGAATLPVDEIHIATSQPEFSRRVIVEESTDGQSWSICGSGDVYRFRQGDAEKESLRVSLDDQWTPYLRIRIVNGNDPPLDGLGVSLYMTPREVLFRQEPGRKYLLLYGQSEAKLPQYDIAQTVNPKQTLAAHQAAGIGPEEINLAWDDPRPWTDRHQIVLWIAAILAALLLAIVALRSLRGPVPPASNP